MLEDNSLILNDDDVVVELKETNTKLSATFLRVHNKRISKKHCACYVCGKHAEITHWHHCIPLEEIAKFMNYGVLAGINKIPMVALCPNCHAYVHKWLNHEFLPVMTANMVEKSITDEEFKKIKALAKVKSDFEDIVIKKCTELQGGHHD